MEWITIEILFTHCLIINLSLDLTTLNYQLEVYVKSFCSIRNFNKQTCFCYYLKANKTLMYTNRDKLVYRVRASHILIPR